MAESRLSRRETFRSGLKEWRTLGEVAFVASLPALYVDPDEFANHYEQVPEEHVSANEHAAAAVCIALLSAMIEAERSPEGLLELLLAGGSVEDALRERS